LKPNEFPIHRVNGNGTASVKKCSGWKECYAKGQRSGGIVELRSHDVSLSQFRVAEQGIHHSIELVNATSNTFSGESPVATLRSIFDKLPSRFVLSHR
jgi:hypothetical protein